MKMTHRPHLDLWISGFALLLAMLLLIASGLFRHHSRQSNRDHLRASFGEPARQ